jgi:hypothetical protein
MRRIWNLPYRLRYHVESRGGPALINGAWDMMLDASAMITIQRSIIILMVLIWMVKP